LRAKTVERILPEPPLISFEIPGLPRLNPADRRHWQVTRREGKRWAELVLYSLPARWRPGTRKNPNPHAFARARVRFVRCSASAQPPDTDNLAWSFKAIRDALIGRVLIDDDPAHLVAEYAWEPAKRTESRVRVEIWDA